MKKNIAFVALGLATTLLLAGCASGTDSSTASAGDATIEIGSLYEPQNLSNFGGGGQGVTEAFNGNVYEGLYRLTDDGSVEPLLAASNTVSDDGLTDRKSTRLNSSHCTPSRMPSSA